MSERNFMELLKKRWEKNLFICVGLDSDFERIPKHLHTRETSEAVARTIFSFNSAIIGRTHFLVCAYKLNSAFYEAKGTGGLKALIRTIEYIHSVAPGVPVIVDAKRGDIGNTNKGYVTTAFAMEKADGITVPPYMGRESLKPFLDEADKGIIVLCRTSNPGAGEFQDLKVDGVPLYQIVARHVAEQWNEKGNCGVVVGATYPEELKKVRQIVGDMPILLPGVGKQAADVEATVINGMNSQRQGMIINSSRGIIFASDGEDFAEAARKKTLALDTQIKEIVKRKSTPT